MKTGHISTQNQMNETRNNILHKENCFRKIITALSKILITQNRLDFELKNFIFTISL